MVNECIHTLNLFLVKQLEANVQAVFQGTIEGDADPMTTIMTERKDLEPFRPFIIASIESKARSKNVSDSVTSFFR